MTYGLIALAGLAIMTGLWYKRWAPHAKRFAEGGYVPPLTGPGKAAYKVAAWLLTALSVGPVKVIGKKNAPKTGKVVFAANHQFPCDFAMVRRGSGRHFRMLTDAAQLTGFFGVLSAWMGIISVRFKEKSDGQVAQAACTRVLTEEANGAVGIFPEGSLLPDNPGMSEMYRPGAVRMALEAAAATGEPVVIVPMAIHYERDINRATFVQRLRAKLRFITFPATRNPRVWNPVMKTPTDGLNEAELADLKRRKAEIMKAHNDNHATIYRGVVVLGEPIDSRTLPADPIKAIEQIKARVIELLAQAKAV